MYDLRFEVAIDPGFDARFLFAPCCTKYFNQIIFIHVAVILTLMTVNVVIPFRSDEETNQSPRSHSATLHATPRSASASEGDPIV